VRGERAKQSTDEQLRAELEVLRDDLARLVAALAAALGRPARKAT